jgi:hypothetical protein
MLNIKTPFFYQDLPMETLIALALGKSTTPALVSGATATYQTFYTINPLISRFFSAGVKGLLTDSTYNPNGIFYYPANIPEKLTISGSQDNFVTVEASCGGFDEIQPVTASVNSASGIGISDTNIPADNGGGTTQGPDSFPQEGYIKIDSEIIYYGSRSSTAFLNCIRGVLGTTAATHADNAAIYTLAGNMTDLDSATVEASAAAAPIAVLSHITFYVNLQSGGSFTAADSFPLTAFKLELNNELKRDPTSATKGRASPPKRKNFSMTLSVDEDTFNELVRLFWYKGNVRLKAKLALTAPEFVSAGDGINYQCNIWLPDLQYSGPAPHKGMFAAGVPNVTHEFSVNVGPTTQPTGFPTQAADEPIVIEFINGRSANILA